MLGLIADLKTPSSSLLFQLEASSDTRLSTPQANFLDTHKTLHCNPQNAEKKPRTQKPWAAQPASVKSSHAKSGPHHPQDSFILPEVGRESKKSPTVITANMRCASHVENQLSYLAFKLNSRAVLGGEYSWHPALDEEAKAPGR